MPLKELHHQKPLSLIFIVLYMVRNPFFNVTHATKYFGILQILNNIYAYILVKNLLHVRYATKDLGRPQILNGINAYILVKNLCNKYNKKFKLSQTLTRHLLKIHTNQ